MSRKPITRAVDFVTAAALPEAPPRLRGATPGAVVTGALEAGKEQAAIVGAEIVTFMPGVDSPWRQDLVNSSMLAQLVAKKRVPDSSRLFDWYDAYFDTLTNIGWALQDKSFAEYEEKSVNFQAHEAILKVAGALLGPATASLALVSTALEALKSMDESSPFITLFNRESQTARTAHFQISVADQSPAGDLSVALMAFGLEASTQLTQVLFFKSLSTLATLRHCSARVGVNADVLLGVRVALKTKLVAHASDWMKTLPDLD
jgi:hypothetical protein